jgi:hypothetical protein
MIAFIDDHREVHGVEPICRMLRIAPSTDFEHVARRSDPSNRPARAKRDAELRPNVRRVGEERFRVCGVVQGLASAASRRDRGRPLHGGSADARDAPSRHRSLQDHPHGRGRQGGTVPARPCEPRLPGA